MPPNARSWRQARQKGIGGSDLPAILGLDRFRGPLDIYRDKTEPLPDEEPPGNPDMERGKALEPLVLPMVSRATGAIVRRPRNVYTHAERPYLRGNLDGIVFDYEGEAQTLLEVKAPRAKTFDTIAALGIPDSWLIQVQHYLGLTPFHRALLAMLNADRWELLLVPIERDNLLIGRLQHAASHFWTAHVQARVPPTAALTVELPDAPGRTLVSLEPSEDAVEALSTFIAARDSLKDYEHLREVAQERLERMLPGFGRFALTDYKIAFTQVQSTRFDRKAAEADGLDLSKYDRPGRPYARLLVTNIQEAQP